jgi:ketosteroid isomerase-like protein
MAVSGTRPKVSETRKEPAVNGKAEEELIRLANEWDRAMVENNAEAIGRYMADDWTIIGSDGSIGDKATFLRLVKSGTLSHDVMESYDLKVRVYGDTAVVTSRGVSGGKYQVGAGLVPARGRPRPTTGGKPAESGNAGQRPAVTAAPTEPGPFNTAVTRH